MNLKQYSEIIAESYYELEPEKELTEEETKILEALEKLNASKAETNKAFNETDDNKHFAQAFKPIAPPSDYVPKSTSSENNPLEHFEHELPENSELKETDYSTFNKVNDLLKKQQETGANTKSTMHYSLSGRKHYYMPTPIYLCETGGKIVINITVNSKGNVTDAYVNRSSTSSNQCLIDHALEYAKEAKFNEDPTKPSQLGSITFNFIGKH